METWIRKEQIYTGSVFNVLTGKARLEDGTIVPREVIEHPGGVAVVPVFEDKVVLVRQYRIAISQNILEIPAGKLEGLEDTEHRGMRELEEETGYRAGLMIPIAPIFASVGYTSEKIHMFLAFKLHKTEQRLEFDERAEPVLIPFSEVQKRLDNNGFLDAKTVIGLRTLIAYVAEHPDIVS